MNTNTAIDIVLGRLEDDGTRFASSLVLSEMDISQKAIAKKTGCFEATFSDATWSNTNTIFADNSIYQVRRVYIGADDLEEMLSSDWANRESLSPPKWLRRGSAMEIYPEPTTEVVYIVAKYLPADLADGVDIALPVELHNALLDHVTASLMLREENPQATFYERRAIDTIEDFDGDEGKILTPWA